MENKKNVLSEAILEFNQLMEAAKDNAKEQLANEIPDKFNKILKEQIDKLEIMKKNIKESAFDNSNMNQEDEHMFEEDINLSDFSMEEIKEIFNGNDDSTDDALNVEDLDENDEFEIEDLESELNGDESTEQINTVGMTENNDENNNDDYNLEGIEEEISKMDDMAEEFEVDENVSSPFKRLKELQEEMNGILDKMNNTPTEDTPVEESHGISHANNRLAGSETQPRPDYAQYKKNQLRFALQKEAYEKRLAVLGESVKKANKKFKDLKVVTENYKDVILKYRNQLNEMVLFNTNLSYVNNLLMNEELNLTKEDKLNIVETFKPVKTINESEQKYNDFLKNKKTGDVINESIERKLTTVVEPNTKTNLGEAVEKNTYVNDAHINKIKKMFNYNSNI